MLFLVEANEEYVGELAQFKKEVLLSDQNHADQFAGCMGLLDCGTEKEWIRFCHSAKRQPARGCDRSASSHRSSRS